MTTDTIPEACEVAYDVQFAKYEIGNLTKRVSQACLAYHKRMAEKAEAEVAELKKHEEQTHATLAPILGADTSLLDGALRLRRELDAIKRAIYAEMNEGQQVQSPQRYLKNILACIKDREDRLSAIQQDVRPLLEIVRMGARIGYPVSKEALETFLAKHPECKP